MDQLVRAGDPFDIAQLVGLLNGSNDIGVQLLAGEALATYAYNNLTNQRSMMAAISGKGQGQALKFDVYRRRLLKSEDELIRCNAAFQVSNRSNVQRSKSFLFKNNKTQI